MLTRAPAGSVVSFMLPNWYEAAVIYLAATLAGMVVNPILPSLRDRELLFILNDVQSRLIFVPSTLRQQDYVAMMSRVTAQLESPPRPFTWVRWKFLWSAVAGDHVLMSRAVDDAGRQQPLARDPLRKDSYELNLCAPVRCSVR